jgi:hypothetical protein
MKIQIDKMDFVGVIYSYFKMTQSLKDIKKVPSRVNYFILQIKRDYENSKKWVSSGVSRSDGLIWSMENINSH